MSNGGVFKLILRDERFDQYFTASDYLRTRLRSIQENRKIKNEQISQPTFNDLGKDHTIYIRSTYKPYVAVASEYTRVKASGSGSSVLGSGGTCEFTFPMYGHFTSDMVLHVKFRAFGSQTATSPSITNPYYRYCALPGLRLFKKIELRSDNIVIDDYTTDDAVASSKFFVRSDHRSGWERCHGQQELKEATFFGNGFTESVSYKDGPQTPKLYQDELDIYVPLQFWFCGDASRALLNDLIPNSQRTIVCTLASITDILQALVPTPPPAPVQPPIVMPNMPVPVGLMQIDLPFNRINMDIDLYVNSLYVNPEVHDIFASRIGFSLIRAHRRQNNQLQSSSDSFLLGGLKFPAEYLMVGFRSRKLFNDFDRWWMMGVPAARLGTNSLIFPAMIWNTAIQLPQLVCKVAVEATTLDSFIDSIGVVAHNVEMFPQLPALFYNGYLPIKYSENSVLISPVDTSEYLINFCLYPGKYDPSGYYNLSAGREMYINYTIKPQYNFAPGEAEMVVSMSGLNFLVRKGDKLSLRYTL